MPIIATQLKVGLEVHIELATQSKMFSRCPSPACAGAVETEPNTLIDPTVLGLPGSLPVMNHAAVEMTILVGLALSCRIAADAKWDRKNYFYPDMPKAYQISQYDMPLCGEGLVNLPRTDANGFPDFSQSPTPIRITRAHLEEDAGKLLHETPGGHAIDYSIVDLNRAGTPLLEIVTEPDFTSADHVVSFCKYLRTLCRHLGVTQGVMQAGHMRFEPNINCLLTLEDGREVATPVVEIKNLNSFRSVKNAIDFECADQPARWQHDGRVFGRGTKITRGWDDVQNRTFIQREKEDAHDYRYFPDPDLLPVHVSAAWREEIRARLPEDPALRTRRYVQELGLAVKEAAALAEEPDVAILHDQVSALLTTAGIPTPRGGRLAANLLLQNAQKRANESGMTVSELALSTRHLADLALLRDRGDISATAMNELFDALCDQPAAELDIAELAQSRGLLIIRNDAALESWIDQVIAANPKPAEDLRAGKQQAAGRLIGEIMKLAGGKADAKQVREALLKRISP